MENTRFTRGMEQLKAIAGKGGENVIKSLESIAPDLGKFNIFAVYSIYRISKGIKCCICGKKGVYGKRAYTITRAKNIIKLSRK